MRVTVIEDKCCGFATCISVAPDVFDIDGDQIAVPLVEGDLPERLHQCAREAAEACPTDAIVIEE
ncbi:MULTISPECIES: ferredoxin [unclassified Nocardioides]|uniref:ferredoxin n=1 Tax=unclassified Nocardioides TaxID=2615069 RepID=UPI003609F321